MTPLDHDKTEVMKDAAAMSAPELLAFLHAAASAGVRWQASHGMVCRPGPSLPVVIIDMTDGASVFIGVNTARQLADLLAADTRWRSNAAVAADLRETAGQSEAAALLHDTLSQRPAKET